MSEPSTPETRESSVRPTRGRSALFDLRWVLALLFGIYGVVVTLTGLLSHAKTYTASGQNVHINVNLWTGIPMLVLALAFALWAQLRPVGVQAVTGDASAGGTDSRG